MWEAEKVRKKSNMAQNCTNLQELRLFQDNIWKLTLFLQLDMGDLRWYLTGFQAAFDQKTAENQMLLQMGPTMKSNQSTCP